MASFLFLIDNQEAFKSIIEPNGKFSALGRKY